MEEIPSDFWISDCYSDLTFFFPAINKITCHVFRNVDLSFHSSSVTQRKYM